MKTFRSLFLILITLLSLFVSITGLVAKIDLASKLLLILFLPVTAYLIYRLGEHIVNKTSVFYQKTGFQRVIVYYCFVVVTTVVSISFLSSQNLPQLISSLIFSPLAFYFLLLVWPRRQDALLPPDGRRAGNKHSELKLLLTPETKLDVERRDFLKLIGSAGILAVLLGLFSKRSGIPSFWGNVNSIESLTLKDSAGNVINPAESSPTEGYNISQIDDSVPSHFGFVNKDGRWFIMKEGEDGAFQYSRGEKDFASNWGNRVKLAYDDFEKVF